MLEKKTHYIYLTNRHKITTVGGYILSTLKNEKETALLCKEEGKCEQG